MKTINKHTLSLGLAPGLFWTCAAPAASSEATAPTGRIYPNPDAPQYK